MKHVSSGRDDLAEEAIVLLGIIINLIDTSLLYIMQL